MPFLTLPVDAKVSASKAKALVFDDPASLALLRRIQQLAPSDATVLISGETGTGKEIVARHLHDLSRRAGRPFVAVNCGAFTETLVDSELFGHDRGAFTGATAARDGWFEAANGGTLFLDEVGDLPAPVQVKLLRVLQEREIVRLGSRQAVPVDVRVVAATNVDLREAVASGRFREDLFYRLNVATLRLAPLRERPGDILRLARHFLAQHRQRLGGPEVELAPDAVDALLTHAWPGNVRELENVVHRAVLVFQHGRITERDLGLAPVAPHAAPGAAPQAELRALERVLVELFERNVPGLHARVEEALVRSAYRYCHENQVQTARLLGVSRNIVRARLMDYGILADSRRGDGDPGRGAAGGGAPGDPRAP
jgi:sigma-54-specific transcriptional regulator